MTGIYFEQFVENGYASCDSDNVMKLHLKGVLNLDDDKFLRLDDVVRKQLHSYALNGKTVVKDKPLMAYKRQNFEYVKKYQAYSYAFCKNNDEELPSGTNFDDSCAYIWKEAWKSETKGKDYESDEFEEVSNDNDDSPEQKGNSKGSKSSQTKNKDIPSRGYIPKCWFTYFFLVSKHSLCT